jgi:hypothetical protein
MGWQHQLLSVPTHYNPESDVSPGEFITPQAHAFAFAFDHLSPTAVKLPLLLPPATMTAWPLP